VAVSVLLATVAIARTVDFREKVPLMRPFADFPLRIGEWNGSRSAMEQMYLDSLHLSDYLLVDYRNPAGKSVNLYVAYYASQRKWESVHSPATCLPGNGWVFEESGPAQISFSGASSPSMTVRRAFMQKSGERMLVYYWFPQRGRVLTGIEQMKLYTFWDALTRQRTDGALVRLITPLDSGEEPAAAEERLRGFCRAAVPVLDEFLPK
jgi:EpsI family protein